MSGKEKAELAQKLEVLVRNYGVRGVTNALGMVVLELASNNEAVMYDATVGNGEQGDILDQEELLQAGQNIKEIVLF